MLTTLQASSCHVAQAKRCLYVTDDMLELYAALSRVRHGPFMIGDRERSVEGP